MPSRVGLAGGRAADAAQRVLPVPESVTDTYRWLSESGHVSRRQAGALATAA